MVHCRAVLGPLTQGFVYSRQRATIDLKQFSHYLAEGGITVAKVDRSVRDLVAMIDREELKLPEMQREYVWRAPRVRDLLDSLYRGYPSGVILAWESDETISTRDFAVETSAPASVRPLLLLDGQQRLTSLSAVLSGEPVSVRGRKRPIEVLFNLDHPDELTFVTEVNESSDGDTAHGGDETTSDIQERMKKLTFVLGTKTLESMPNWVRVSEVFRADPWELLESKGFEVGHMDKDLRSKYTTRLQNLRGIENYEYRMDVLERSKSYEEVTEIFVRVNSLGAKLRSSDLALAQITAKWRGSLKIFHDYQQELDRGGFDVEIGTIIKALIAMATGQSKFLTVNSLTLQTLQEAWARTTKSLDFALNFLQSNIGIDSPRLLSSPFLLITTAFWADKRGFAIEPEESAGFRQWLLIANAKGRYSRGSSESLLDQDLATLRNGGHPAELLARIIQQVGRLSFSIEDLAGRTSRSGAFRTMFLAFREDKARDWSTNLEISPKHHGRSDAIEYHHIFPKAYMKRTRPDVDRAFVDDIANLAFIGSDTNKKISARAPSDYKTDFEQSHFANQQISFENGLDEPAMFDNFIEVRRRKIAQRLNQFLGVKEGE